MTRLWAIQQLGLDNQRRDVPFFYLGEPSRFWTDNRADPAIVTFETPHEAQA